MIQVCGSRNLLNLFTFQVTSMKRRDVKETAIGSGGSNVYNLVWYLF